MYRNEEKPLLVSILDTSRGRKGSDDETYAAAKYGHSSTMIKRWKYGVQNNGKGRARGIMAGASSIIDKWPENMTMCWLIGVAIFMIIITCVFMIQSSLKSSVPISFSALSIQKKCLAHHESAFKNSPSQYPEKTNVYLHFILNGKEKFETNKYKDLFGSVVDHHPNHFINVYVLYNDTGELGYKRNTRFKDWELYHNTFDDPRFFATSSVEEENAIQRNSPDVIDFENINIVRSSLSSYFLHSPLKHRWRLIPDTMIPFVLRVLSLWEHGGITMPWQLFKDKMDVYCVQKDNTGQFQDMMHGFKKKDSFMKETTTVRLTKKEIAEELQPVIDISKGGGGLTGLPQMETIERTIEEPLRNFNLNDTIQNVPTEKKIVPKKINHPDLKELAKQLQGKKAKAHDEGSIIKMLNEKNNKESLPPASLSSSKFFNEMQKELLDENKKSEDLSSMEKQIRELLKNPKIKKKLKQVDVNNILDQDNRLKRTKRDLNDKVPVNTLPPLNMDAVKKPSEISAKPVRHSPHSSSRFYKYSSRSGHFRSSSDYHDHSSSEDDSYSGLNAPHRKFKDRNNHHKHVNKPEIPLDAVNTLKGISKPASSSSISSSSSDYFNEKRSYVHHKTFDTMNVFAMPHKMVITTDRFGYYFSTKRPCHAYLGELISTLQSSVELENAEFVVEKALKIFCKGHKFSECTGVHLL